MKIESQGFGAGDKDFPDRANVLRVIVGTASAATEATTVTVIEANVDDSTPEVLAFAMERLLSGGALDATIQPIYMKKNRVGSKISVIAAPEQAETLASIVFAETSTLGIRMYEAQRRVLARSFRQVHTPYGTVQVKEGENGTFAPEYDDCRRLALEHNVPLRTVMAEATRSFLRSTSN
jgi:uncharacterized protein (DUF111 family)